MSVAYFVSRIQVSGRSPECIVEDDKHNIYAGMENGNIIRIHTGMLGDIGEGRKEIVINIKFPGASRTDYYAKNGRPLGKHFIYTIAIGALFVQIVG